MAVLIDYPVSLLNWLVCSRFDVAPGSELTQLMSKDSVKQGN
jgi:hypothetical protein